jgi:hypothetical protein
MAGNIQPLVGESGPGPGAGPGPPLHPFLVAAAEAFGRPVCRLGLASYGDTAITPDEVLSAVGRGGQLPELAGPGGGPVRR